MPRGRRPGRPPLRWAALLLLVGVLSACTEDADGPAAAPAGALPPAGFEASGPTPEVVELAQLGEPVTGLTATSDGLTTFVARRSGAVFALRTEERNGHRVPTLDPIPVLDLTGTVTTDGERGLLDVLLSADDRVLYTSYTDEEGAVTVASYPADPAAGTVAGDRGQVLARVTHPFSGHNGGDLEWLDEDSLLWSVGDMDLTTSVPPAAQDPDRPLGTIVRLDLDEVDGTPVLTDEDLVGDRTVARGLRNPWRIHVDRDGGRLLIGDVGEDAFEEVDAVDLDTLDDVAAGTAPPPNFGWPHVEGTEPTELPAPAGADFVDPVVVRPHAEDVCSITLGVPAPDHLGPAAGDLLVGDLCSGRIVALGEDDSLTEVATVGDGTVSFAVGADGEVYVLGRAGGLWRLDPEGWQVDDPAPPEVPPPPAADSATTPLDPAGLQAVCDTLDAFALLEPIVGAGPEVVEPAIRRASATFAAAAPDLPDAVDPAPLQLVLDRAAQVGRAADWDGRRPELQALQAEVNAATRPFEDFPAAMGALVDLGAAC